MSLNFNIFRNPLHTQKQLLIKTDEELASDRMRFQEENKFNSNLGLVTSVYEIIRSIKDPERPYTLEQLQVVS